MPTQRNTIGFTRRLSALTSVLARLVVYIEDSGSASERPLIPCHPGDQAAIELGFGLVVDGAIAGDSFTALLREIRALVDFYRDGDLTFVEGRICSYQVDRLGVHAAQERQIIPMIERPVGEVRSGHYAVNSA